MPRVTQLVAKLVFIRLFFINQRVNEKDSKVRDLKSSMKWRGFERKLIDGAVSGPASPCNFLLHYPPSPPLL